MKSHKVIIALVLTVLLAPLAQGKLVDLPRKPHPLVKVTFPNLSGFKVSFGQKIPLCSQVAPTSFKSDVVMVSNPKGTLDVKRAASSVPTCSQDGQELWEVRSTASNCAEIASVLATFKGTQVGFLTGVIITPQSEVAVLRNSGKNNELNPDDGKPGCATPGLGCLFKNYNVLFKGPENETLVLDGLKIAEFVSEIKKECPFGSPISKIGDAQLDPNSNLWGIGDHLEIPAGSAVSCEDQFSQTVLDGDCQVQTNILTLSVDGAGNRSITRSDEGPLP